MLQHHVTSGGLAGISGSGLHGLHHHHQPQPRQEMIHSICHPHDKLNFDMKTTSKLKINHIREYLGLVIYPIKPSAGLFNLIKSREAIPYKDLLMPILTFFKKNFWSLLSDIPAMSRHK
jgi:hypothetical protein